MKKLIGVLMLTLSFAAIGVGQNPNNKISQGKHGANYCATLNDGITKVQSEGSYITSDVTLGNGTVIKTDGTIMKREGGQLLLKNGECVDTAGMVITVQEYVPADKNKQLKTRRK